MTSTTSSSGHSFTTRRRPTGEDDGAAYIVRGASVSSLPAELWLDDASVVKLTGELPEDNAGYSVSSAGDVNGDGLGDLLIGAWLSDLGGIDAGAVYLLYGRPTLSGIQSLTVAADATLVAATTNDFAGNAVAGAGDMNDDGFDDFLIAAWREDSGGLDAGAVFYLYGSGGI